MRSISRYTEIRDHFQKMLLLLKFGNLKGSGGGCGWDWNKSTIIGKTSFTIILTNWAKLWISDEFACDFFLRELCITIKEILIFFVIFFSGNMAMPSNSLIYTLVGSKLYYKPYLQLDVCCLWYVFL